MGGLQKFEQRLEGWISGAFARAFRSAVQPVEIAAALQREVDNNSQILSRQRRLAPNDFHVELSPPDMTRLAPYDSTLAEELKQQLKQHADQQGFVFPGRITIEFEEHPDLTTGRFRIKSRALAGVSGASMTDTQVRRARAYLEINGTRHPLHASVVVGRGTDADLRINDPGVSRRHVEFRMRGSDDRLHLEVRDLGSTNGMLVDGQKMGSAVVDDGSQVRIGTTTITVHVVEETQ
ncbi:DUF3662 and FHA domain-containing protein [Nocardioides sp. KR10-350]|uniref:DUF3662 and FHA domain-containing protein n=1 Tax=Nocardioides cheoyonin TaxID=3156615 RepID=UPI0032B61882